MKGSVVSYRVVRNGKAQGAYVGGALGLDRFLGMHVYSRPMRRSPKEVRKDPMKRVIVLLTESLHREVERAAKKRGISFSAEVRRRVAEK
jgi:hypothetical protein